MRVVEAGKSEAADERAETRLFSALDSALRDVPPSRIGGAIMVTDGQVHDVPALNLGFSAPLHALITGNDGEEDRRIRFEKAPRFGIVGKPLELTYRVIGANGETGQVDVRVSINGEQVARSSAPPSARKCRSDRSSPAPAATSSNFPSTRCRAN